MIQVTYAEGGYDFNDPYGNVVEILQLPDEGEEGNPTVVPESDWGIYLNPQTHEP